MTQIKNMLRGAVGLWMLDEAQKTVTGGKPEIFLVRVALAVVLMYLIMISYMLMGPTGVIVISILFIVCLLGPAWMWLIWRRRKNSDESEEL
jgi:Flp pilus assembly protein TadB